MLVVGLGPTISNLFIQVTVLKSSNRVGGRIKTYHKWSIIQVTVLESSNRVGGWIKTYYK